MTIEFEATTEPVGIEVYDSIEQRRLQLETDCAVEPAIADTEGFCFPVDTTCRFSVTELVFDQLYSVSIHDATGQTEASFDVGETAQLDDRTQFVGLSGPIKLYCRVDVSGTLDIGLTSIRLALDEPTTVKLGARSPHDRPAGTITTPPDVDAMMDAVSMLPSALKTTSPERTWPTLRGHPPLIELGEEFSAPDDVELPDSDVELVVPPSYLSLYQVAPLAFFLGATVRSGSQARLETPGFQRSLGEHNPLADDVAGLLKRFFFLDCLTRTEGLFQYDLHERAVLEDELPFDLAETYEEPLPVRLERFLEVPHELIEPYVPRWPLTAHVPADADSIEVVPFIVNELGIVRESHGSTPETVPRADIPEAEVARSAQTYRTPSPTHDASSFIEPAVTDESIEHAWFGDAIPRGASKATVDAYRNQLERDERSESIEILLVCNDAEMIGEHDLLDETYGNRDALPFEIHSEFGVATDRLAELLTDGGYDFLHYIGHATEDGLRCPDGELDVRTLESVDIGVFFLNACRSYEQGLALTRRGAFGGVSTYSDIANTGATEAGETLARLLNRGFPLRSALEIAREHSALGDQYLIVGDGSADIAQTHSGAPMVIEIDQYDEDVYDFSVQSYSTKEFKLGTATESTLPAVSDRHLSPARTPPTRVDEASLREFFTWNAPAVRLDGELVWCDGFVSTPLD